LKTVKLEERDRRRQKKDRKNAWLKTQVSTNEDEEENILGYDAEDADDWEELKREDRIAKKAKRIGPDTVDL